MAQGLTDAQLNALGTKSAKGLTDDQLSAMEKSISDVDALVRDEAIRQGVDPKFALNIRRNESGSSNNPRITGKPVKSDDGSIHRALGPMQVMDYNFAKGEDPYDLRTNIRRGVSMLKNYLARFDNNPTLAAAAYNWGPANVARNGMRLPHDVQQYASAAVEGLNDHMPTSRQVGLTDAQLFAKTRKRAGQEAAPKPISNVQIAGMDYKKGLQKAGQIAKTAGDALNASPVGRVYAHAKRVVDEAADDASQTLNAVLGAPQRFVAGALAADKDAGGLGAATPAKEGSKGLYAAFHPNDSADTQRKAEQVANVERFRVAHPKSWVDNLRNFGVDYGFQTATDPLTYLGGFGLIERAGSKVIAGSGRLAEQMVTGQRGKGMQTIANAMVPNPKQYEAFTAKGRAEFQAAQEEQAAVESRLRATDDELLAKHKHDLKRGIVSPEVVNYIKNREAGVVQQYGPNDLFPSNVPRDQWTVPQEITKSGSGNKFFQAPKYPWQKNSRFDSGIPKDPYDAVKERLMATRDIAADKHFRTAAAQKLGFGQLAAKGQPKPKLTVAQTQALQPIQKEMLRDKEMALKLLTDPQSWFEQFFEKVPFLQDLSNWQRDVLIVNGLPHMGNISFLTYLAGGPAAVARGMYLAARGGPKLQSLVTRLENIGAGSHFSTLHVHGPAALVPKPLAHLSQTMLDRVDMSMRAARLEQLDKFSPGLSDAEKAQIVRQDLGDYRNQPNYVQMAKMLGGNFPQWHGYVVPTAVARALLRHPERVEQLQRLQTVLNQDFLTDQGYKIEFNKPGDEFSKMVTLPTGTGRYLTTESMIGPLSAFVRKYAPMTQEDSYSVSDDIVKYITELLPYESIWGPQVGLNPFHSKAPADLQSVLGVFGMSAKNIPRGQSAFVKSFVRNAMESGHMDNYHATNLAKKIWQRIQQSTRQ